MKFFLNRRYQLDTLDVYLSVIFISACTVVKRPLLSIFFNNWAVLKDYIFAFVRRVYFILAIFYFLFCWYILTAVRSTYRTFIFCSSKKKNGERSKITRNNSWPVKKVYIQMKGDIFRQTWLNSIVVLACIHNIKILWVPLEVIFIQFGLDI